MFLVWADLLSIAAATLEDCCVGFAALVYYWVVASRCSLLSSKCGLPLHLLLGFSEVAAAFPLRSVGECGVAPFFVVMGDCWCGPSHCLPLVWADPLSWMWLTTAASCSIVVGVWGFAMAPCLLLLEHWLYGATSFVGWCDCVVRYPCPLLRLFLLCSATLLIIVLTGPPLQQSRSVLVFEPRPPLSFCFVWGLVLIIFSVWGFHQQISE
jgi:hypothetical protein